MDTSVQALRNYIRLFVDVDNTDIPDGLADTWTNLGWKDLIGTDLRWPFFEIGNNAIGSAGSTNPGTTYTINTVVGQQNYKLPTFTVQSLNAVVEPRNIVAVQGPHWELLYASHTALESTFTPAFIVSQEPERISFWGGMMTMWPIPNSVYLINIRAYRNPIDWVSLGAGGLVDAPDDFWTVLSHYVLAMAWGQQTDLQQASFWMDQYAAGKAMLTRKYLRAPMPENIVLNGGQVTRELPPRLRFPFEGMSQVGLTQ